MTALTAGAAPAGRRHPVPWRPMARATWRQHRAALITLLAVSTALALATVAGELAIRALYARYVAGCIVPQASDANCGNVANTFAASTNGFTALVIALHVLPIVIGVFVGAPLVSRELESGTFRFTWTQEIGRTRYVLTTVALLALAAAAVACVLGALLGWYAHPFDVVGDESRWQAGLFDTTALMLPAWTLFALGAGTLLGTLTGRIVTAMAATAAAAGGFLIAAFWTLDRHLLSLGALATRVTAPGGVFVGTLNTSAGSGSGAAGSWLVRGWITGPGGRELGPTAADDVQNRMYAAMANAGKKADPGAWLSAHHYVQWLSYQPAGRFWYFQAIAAAVLVALAIVFALTTAWLVRRRG
jgi:hypothetical protein